MYKYLRIILEQIFEQNFYIIFILKITNFYKILTTVFKFFVIFQKKNKNREKIKVVQTVDRYCLCLIFQNKNL